MGIGSSMKDLVQGIASSHEGRLNAVGNIKEEARRLSGEARALIKGFETSRTEAGAKLRTDLAADKAGRKSDVEGLIKGLSRSRKEGGAQLRQELTQGAARRRANVSAARGDARQAISSFRTQRSEAGSKLREDLSRSRSSREAKVGELRKTARDLIQETGDKLRDDLAKARADRESSVTEMMGKFHEFRSAVRSDINEARTAWQELTRKGEKVPAGAKAGAVKAEPRVAEEEVPDLETKLLTAVGEHPQGISLDEVAESLGVARIVLGRVSKRLLDAGKTRKEDKLYFPVSG